jgi:hypothetical protein
LRVGEARLPQLATASAAFATETPLSAKTSFREPPSPHPPLDADRDPALPVALWGAGFLLSGSAGR